MVLPSGTGASPTRSKVTAAETPLVEQWRSGAQSALLALTNKAPMWNEELRTYTLEYNGRATLASVKNIQLVPEHAPDDLHFQMGKVSEARFNVDWKAPLSPMQAV